MSVAIPNRRTWKTALAWGGLALVAFLIAVNLLHDSLFHGRALKASSPPEAAEAAAAASAPAGGEPATTVTLPEGKWKVAAITTAPAERTRVAAEVGVTGRIEANTDRQVEVRPRANGIIRTVHATLGQKVGRGDRLVVLDSPDVGTARLNLHNRQRELVTARTEAAWKNEVAANVARLIPELRALTAEEPGKSAAGRHIDEHNRAAIETKYATIEKKYADRPLGASRGVLLEAYANFEIAHHESEKTSGLFRDQIVGEHPAFLAKHTAEGAQAKFEAALEQVRFDANQQKLVADQQAKNAEAAVIDAAQRLRILGVDADIPGLLAHPETALGSTVDEDVTNYTIVAPFEGTIITKNAVPSQKAEMNDVLFTLADLSNVWVVANVYESDFASLHALRGGSVRLTATAYPGRSFEARLLSIGAVVDPATRTVPILAETQNPDDMFKLNMFVRISLDAAATEELVTVPISAVVEIEGRAGVFLPVGEKAGDRPGHTYRFHPVKLGREAGTRQAVLAGLEEGEAVVATGAFFLKSELILQNEPEED
jgi:multidrug efflux pump subunit AcrA (membrane-fusion protein)